MKDYERRLLDQFEFQRIQSKEKKVPAKAPRNQQRLSRAQDLCAFASLLEPVFLVANLKPTSK
jgi:hypothetical protein